MSYDHGLVIVNLDCPVMLVTCHPPTGCDIGCMTAWTFCLLDGCVSDLTIVLSTDWGLVVRSYCNVPATDHATVQSHASGLVPTAIILGHAMSSHVTHEMWGLLYSRTMRT